MTLLDSEYPSSSSLQRILTQVIAGAPISSGERTAAHMASVVYDIRLHSDPCICLHRLRHGMILTSRKPLHICVNTPAPATSCRSTRMVNH